VGRYGEQLEHLFSVFPRDQVLVVFYRDLREHPQSTLDDVCGFLGIEAGVISEVPAMNVTAESSPSRLNDAISRLLRHGAAAGRWLPGQIRERVSGPAVRLLQREQRPRAPLRPAERAALIPEFEPDIRRLEELLGVSLPHWRDMRNGSARKALDVNGPFGTGYSSIDRPSARSNRP